MGMRATEYNKEEYKGLFKLLLQRSNFALFVCLFAAVLGLLVPAPADATFLVTGNNYPHNTDADSVIRNPGQASAILPSATSGVFNLSYFRQPTASFPKPELDTKYASVTDSPSDKIQAIYGDTLILISAPSAIHDSFLISGTSLYDTVYLSTDTTTLGDTVTYIFSVTNYANTRDTLGLIIDTAWTLMSGSDSPTPGKFTYQFFNRKGDTLTGVLSYVQQDTGRISLAANAAETVILRIYGNASAAGDTVRAAVRAYANNATGRWPGSNVEVAPYRGFNKVKYGGDGNAAQYVEVTVSGALIRLAQTDTVFSPVALTGGAADTQVYVPGALIVSTIWFDNDGNDTADTITIEDWIDTRHLRFDTAGLSALKNQTDPGLKAAAPQGYIDSNYGNIFIDSAMPGITGGAGYRVQVEYVGAAGTWTSLTAATPAESVARIRWVISRVGGVIGATNGDNAIAIDAININPAMNVTDIDRGFVRFSTVIR